MNEQRYHVFRRSNSPNWYVWRYRDGRRLPKSTGLAISQYTREQAQQLIDGLSGVEPTIGRNTISWLRNHIIARMMTESRSENTINQFRIAFDYLESVYGQDHDISNITRAAVWKVKEHGFLKGVSARTINTRLAYLHSAFNMLIKDDVIEHNPFTHFERVKAPGGERKALTLEQLRSFIIVLDAWPHEVARRLIRIILYTGLRRSEILYLRREDIEFSQIGQTGAETGQGDTISVSGISTPVRFRPMNVKRRDKRRRLLSIPMSAREDIAWFLDNFRGNYPFRQCHLHTVTDWAKKIFRAAGLPEYNTKSLRHTFATRALELGIPIRDLQRYLDHSDTRITEIYAHDLDRQDLDIDIGI